MIGKGGRILIIDFTNYEDYPIGGYLSFAKSMMNSFGNDLALAGITTSSQDPVGKWFKKDIMAVKYDFFAMARYNKSKTKHFLPDRLVNYLLLKYFQKRLLAINIKNVFIQRQEMLIALSKGAINICYCFAGLENPLTISKYWYAHSFSKLFEKRFFRKLKSVDTILASGDDSEIREMAKRSKGKVSESRVIKFPTRINTDIFRPVDKNEARRNLNIAHDSVVIVTTGRLAVLKGWKFMIDCFLKFEMDVPGSKLHFIGEGEDFEKIKSYLSINKLTEKVFFEGKKEPYTVAMFLNAADLFIMGSYKEGWSTSLMEAVACGTPSCVTDFSSAREIIIEGENGFVIENHNEERFVLGMLNAMNIKRPVMNDHIHSFSTNRLKTDLLKYWTLI